MTADAVPCATRARAPPYISPAAAVPDACVIVHDASCACGTPCATGQGPRGNPEVVTREDVHTTSLRLHVRSKFPSKISRAIPERSFCMIIEVHHSTTDRPALEVHSMTLHI